MHNHIRVYENALTRELCAQIKGFFNASKNLHRRPVHDALNFTEVNLSACESSKALHDALALNQLHCLRTYMKDLDVQDSQFSIGPGYRFEQFRIKRYQPTEEFKLHTDDAGNRVVAFLYYLNSDFTGGTTSFPHHNVVIKPKAGTLLMFPTSWEYLHSGDPVFEGEKYILSSYLVKHATRN